MGDEAFARRYYADRAELQGLGVPITSGRDEFTGEELYTLREEQYFLPPIDLNDQELAALLNCLGMLDGQFAYAEPLRLALQNLALGRHVSADPGSDSVRVNLLGSVYTPEIAQRLAKLELAISKQRTVRFSYRSLGGGERRERQINPYGLFELNSVWYVIGDDLEVPRGGAAAQDLPRLADGQRDQVRHPPRARLPDPRRLRRQRLPRPAVLAAGRRDRGRGGALDRPRQHVRRPPAVRPAQRDRPSTTTARRRWSPSTPTWSRCPSWCSQHLGQVRPVEPPELARMVEKDLRGSSGCTGPADRDATARAAGREHSAAQHRRPRPGSGRARAVRAAPGAARVPARALRRRDLGDRFLGGHPRSVPAQPGRAAGAPRPAQPGQLRRRLLRGLLRDRQRLGAWSTRSCTATPSAVRRGCRRSRRRR